MAESGSVVLQVGALVVLVLFLLYRQVKARYRYFEERGVPFHKPTILLGLFWRATLGLDHINKILSQLYNDFKGANVVGAFQGLSPMYVIRDPEMVHRLLIKDFSSFTDRTIRVDEKFNPLDANLLFLSGEKWRALRILLSPTFTSGKLKWMYAQMEVCGRLLLDMVEQETAKGDVEVKDLLGRLTTDVISSCAFGLEPESIKDPDSNFRVYGKRILSQDFFRNLIRFLSIAIPPNFISLLKVKTIPKDIEDFFTRTVSQIIDHRRKTGCVRKDFVQLLLQLKEKGFVDVDPRDTQDEVMEQFKTSLGDEKIEVTDELLTAQALSFFVAGFETAATTMTWALYLLAKHQEVQEKARKEIREVKEKHGGFNYEALKELHYLENCLNETLRMYTTSPLLGRKCTKSVNVGHLRIEKGVNVIIPAHAIHMDPEIYPKPQEYRPERFQEGQGKRPGTYIPFGAGPRMCIGKRFAMVEMKMAVALILDSYRVRMSEKTKEPVEMNKRGSLLSPKVGIWLKFDKPDTVL